MADEKQFSESEHIAILADRVQKETADLTAERDQLQARITELETKLDVETAAKQAAEQRATEVETSFESFKTEVAEKEQAAARKDERVAKVKEVASHLDDKFFEDEARVARIVAMDEDTFTGYLSDLGATAKVPGNTGSGGVPRETAMAGQSAGGSEPVAKAGQSFLMRQFVAPTQKEG